MSTNDVTVVLAHGAWADGSSWAKVIEGLKAQGIPSIAAALPLTHPSGRSRGDRPGHRASLGRRGGRGPRLCRRRRRRGELG